MSEVSASSHTLTNAVLRAADRLGISHTDVAKILDVSPSDVSRMAEHAYQLAESRKEWELGILFVRLFHSLDAIAGDEARNWMANHNDALGGTPAQMILTAPGLARVVEYLEASLARP